jgi:hypothetical protein
VFAGSPGESPTTSTRLIAHLLGLLAGAVAITGVFAAVTAATTHVPLETVGVVALASALLSALVHQRIWPQSRWRVPEHWARFGPRISAFLFGAALGMGVLTAVGSAGLYTLLAWGLAADWSDVLVVFGCFAAARAVTLLVVHWRGGWAGDALDRVTATSERLVAGEALLLATVGVLALGA